MPTQVDSLEVKIQSSADGAVASLEKLRQKLKETLNVMNSTTKSTTQAMSSAKYLSDRLANSLIKDFGIASKTMQQQIRDLSQSLYNVGKREINTTAISELVKKTSEAASSVRILDSDYQRAFKSIKSMKISVNPFDIQGMGKETWKELKSALPNVLQQLNPKKFQTSIDQAYQQLNSEFSHLFPSNIAGAEDQLRQIVSVINQARQETKGVAQSAEYVKQQENAIKNSVWATADAFARLQEISKKPLDTQMQVLRSQIEAVREEMTAASAMGDMGKYGRLQEKMTGYTTALDAVINRQRELLTQSQNANPMKNFQAQLDGVSNGMSKLASSIDVFNGAGLKNLAEGIQLIGKAVADNRESFDGKKIQPFVTVMKKMSTIDSKKLYQAGIGIKSLASGMTTLSGVNFSDNGIRNMINAIVRLSNSKVNDINTSKFKNLGSAMAEMARELENARSIDKSIIAMVNAIAKLAGSAQGIPIIVTNIGQLGAQLKRFVNDMSGVNIIANETIQFTQAIAQLANAGEKIKGSINGLSQLSTELLKVFQVMQNAPQISQNTIQFTQTLAQLASARGSISGLGSNFSETSGRGKELSNVFSSLKSVTSALANSFKTLGVAMGTPLVKLGQFSLKTLGYITGMNRIININKQGASSYNKLTSAIGMFYAKYFLVMRMLKLVWSAVGESVDYVETYNFFNVALNKMGKEAAVKMGEMGEESANAYVDSYKSVLGERTQEMTGFTVDESGALIDTGTVGLGLDPNQLMNFQAQILSVTNSAGMLQNTSVNTAKALSMLSSDLSSLTNTDLSTVMQNLQSGLIGQSRALYKYGIDITNTNLKQLALEEGIKKSVSAMTQQEKIQLRILAILRQSRVAWGDQGNTINTAANQYRVLKQQLQNVGRTIGNLLIPIVEKALPVINGMVIALNRMLTTLGFSLFGKNWLSDLMSEVSSGNIEGLDDLEDDLDDVADAEDEATKKAKEFKKQLQGIDELNVLSKPDDSDSGSSSSGNDNGAGGSIDLSGAIADELANYDKIWEDALKGHENLAEQWADKISSAFNNAFTLGDTIGTKLTAALNAVPWEDIKAFARQKGNELASFFNGLISPELLDGIGEAFAERINTEFEFLDGFAKVFSFTNLGESIASGLNTCLSTIKWKTILSAYSTWGDGIAETLNAFVDKGNFTLIGETVAQHINALGSFFEKFFKKFDGWKVGEKLQDAIDGFYDNIDWKKLEKASYGFGQDVGQILSGISIPNKDGVGGLEKIGKTIKNSVNVIIEAFDGLADYTRFNTIGKDLKNGINEILNIDWDKFVNVSEKFGRGLSDFANALFSDDGNGQSFSGGIAHFVEENQSLGNGIGTAFAGLFNGYTGFISEFSSNLDTELLGNNISEALQTAFNDINWGNISSMMSSGIANGLDLVAGIISGINWKGLPGQLVDNLYEYLSNFNWSKLSKSVGSIAGALLGAVINFEIGLAEFWVGIPKKIFDYFSQAIKDAGWSEDNSLAENGLYLIEGIFNGIVSFFANIGTWVKDNIFNPFIEGFKDTFDIHSPSKNEDIIELGANIILGVFSGITDFISGIGDWIDKNIFTPFTTAFDKYFGKDSKIGISLPTWSEIKKTAGDLASDFKSWIDGLAKKIGISLPTWSDIKKNADDLWRGIKDWIDNKKERFGITLPTWSEIKEIAEKRWTSFKKWISKKKDKFGITVPSWSDIKKTANERWESFKKWINDKAGKFGIKFPTWDEIKSLPGVLWDSFTKWISDKVVMFNIKFPTWSSLQSTAKSLANSIIGFFNNLINKINSCFRIKWSAVEFAGKTIIPAVDKQLVTLPTVPLLKADGGVYSQGTWKSIDQYASGGIPSHGTHFIAGENGAEAVGHINGRTEVLNQSQMASVMYNAVYNAVDAVMSRYNGQNSGDTVVQIDGKEVARATQKVANDYMRRTGNPYFAY